MPAFFPLGKLPQKLFFFFKNRRDRAELDRSLREAENMVRPRTELPFRLVYVFRDNPFDLHSREMGLHLLRNYSPVKVISFVEGERIRGSTHLSTPALLAQIDEFRPDVVFAFDKFLSPAEAAALRERKILLVATNDGFASFDSDVLPQPEAISLLRNFSAFFVAHAPHVERLRKEGIRAEAFPLWADTELFRPIPVEKDIDVLFIGTNSGHSREYRQPLLKLLSETARLTVAGPRDQFQELPNAHVIGPVTAKEEVNRLFNRAKIVLGFDKLTNEVIAANKRVNQIHFYDDVKFQIKDRTTCVMASGACYFAEDHEENRRLFRAGEEIILWNGAEDLAQKTLHFLREDAARAEVGARARARVLRDYSVDVRARQMIDSVSRLLREKRADLGVTNAAVLE